MEFIGGGNISKNQPSVGKQVIVGICAMEKKSLSKPMKEILSRMEEFEYIKIFIFPESTIIHQPVPEWPICDCLIAFHSKGFPLDKAIEYAKLRNPYIINNLEMQIGIQDRRCVYNILQNEGIEIPRFAVLNRSSQDPTENRIEEYDDHIVVNGVVFNKPFVEKPISAEDHNIYIYYPASAGGGSQHLFRKVGSRSSVYSSETGVRTSGSYIYEDFMATDGTDVKVYTVGPDYAHAEARKSPALDGKVERDLEGKEVRYPVILSNKEKLIARKVCLAFKQMVCGFDLLRANGKSYVCDVNGFSFVKNSSKYYDDCAKILGNMILRELAPTLDIPWTMPFQLDDPPIVPTTVGKMMELRCVVAVIRHGDRTPKQKMKLEVKHPKFFDLFKKYGGDKCAHIKLKKPKQLQEILDIARELIDQIQSGSSDADLIEEKKTKLEQIKNVLQMYGHFSGINRKVQLKFQPKGRPRSSSSEEEETPKEPSLLLILKWGGELTPSGREQAEELGRVFRCMYPGGQDLLIGGLPPAMETSPTAVPLHLKVSQSGEYSGSQGLGLLRLHSTYRHDLKIYASDEGRVQMTAAAFAKGLLALDGELTPILVQMVKSANTNGLLDNDSDCSRKYQKMVKGKLHEMMHHDQDFSAEEMLSLNPSGQKSIERALRLIKNPVACCKLLYSLIQQLNDLIKRLRMEHGDEVLYHGETWELMARRWGKLEKDFLSKTGVFDISKIPDIYDCIKYDLQHNRIIMQSFEAVELYNNAKNMADVVIPQEYGLTKTEKLTIAQGICAPLLRKIRADLQRNIEAESEFPDDNAPVNRLNPRYSSGVSSPGRHVRTRLYFTSESHIHSLLTVFCEGGLVDGDDEQWKRAMDYVSVVSELNYMTQIVIMLYEDPTKDISSEQRFHVELHFSPGVNCCVQKNLPPGPGFRPHSRNQDQGVAGSPNSSTESDQNSMAVSPPPPLPLFSISGADRDSPDSNVKTTPIVSIKCSEEKLGVLFRDAQNIEGTDGADNKDMGNTGGIQRCCSTSSWSWRHSTASTILEESGSTGNSANGSFFAYSKDAVDDNVSRSRKRSRSLEKQRGDKTDNSFEQNAAHVESTMSICKDDQSRNSQSMNDIKTEGTSFCRYHRRSLPGHNMSSYITFLNKKMPSTSQLFSTAVITGSSSAPNLKGTQQQEFNSGMPNVRSLETLHNALSLCQLDAFLEFATSADFKTPPSSVQSPIITATVSDECDPASAENNKKLDRKSLSPSLAFVNYYIGNFRHLSFLLFFI